MLFKRILSSHILRRLSRIKLSSLNFVLSDHQTEILNGCIFHLRSEIFKIEDETISLLSNLLTITRCLMVLTASYYQLQLPCPRADGNGNYTIRDLRLEIVQLARACAEEIKQLQSTRFRDSIEASKLRPSEQCIEQMRICETDRIISPPTSINAAYLYQTKQAKAQVELEMLVLKKAEMLVKVEELGKDVKFWTKLYSKVKGYQILEDVRPSIRRKEVPICCMRNSWLSQPEKRDEDDSGISV